MLKMPLYNQYYDPLPDGQQDPYASTDCGEECVSMVGAAYGYGGVCGYSAGQIRVIMRRGQITGAGISMAHDLVYALWSCFRLAATEASWSASQATNALALAMEQRRPVIILGHWDGPPHWIVCGAVNKEGITGLDPAGGFVHQFTWAEFNSLYLGSAAEVRVPLPQP